MHQLFYFALLICLALPFHLFAQDKFEKESRIKPDEIPAEALSFMDSLNYEAKIKWFKEEGLTRKSIEAKFKYENTKFSVEFNLLGNIEDIEIEVNWQNIEPETTDSISKHLQLDCSKFKIVKVQKQFAGSKNDLFFRFPNEANSEKTEIKYEIIVKCYQQKEVNLFEYSFNEKGIPLTKSKIVFKNSSHLEY
ncbi:MAG: hypothetical protein IPI11_02330 [Haliscomenobacter sp.]|nr:hypothetical protein [Haliscomenobacter sp.]